MHLTVQHTNMKYMKQTLIKLKKEIDSNIMVIRYFNIPLSMTGRTMNQKVNKRRHEKNNID